MTWLTSVAVLSQQHDLPGATAQRPFALAPENTFRRFHVKILTIPKKTFVELNQTTAARGRRAVEQRRRQNSGGAWHALPPRSHAAPSKARSTPPVTSHPALARARALMAPRRSKATGGNQAGRRDLWIVSAQLESIV